MASQFEEGMLVGLLIGEGHFGGDGRQPQVTLRMHVRHEALFRWLERTFPGGRLYGPYEHGGRRYYQWMARGAYLREELVPLLRDRLGPSLDRYAHGRLLAMCDHYSKHLEQLGPSPGELGGSAAPGVQASTEPQDTGRPGPTAPAEPAAPSDASAIFATLREAHPDG